MKTFHPSLKKYERVCISIFIIITTIVFVCVGKPKELLIAAGLVNGFILPVALAIILVAATKPLLMKGYKHPVWMQASGWIVVVIMCWMAGRALLDLLQ